MTNIHPDLQHLAQPIGVFNLDPNNRRIHGARNREAVRGMLERFGQRLPIVVRRQGMIVEAGNCRLEEAIGLGWTHIAAVVCDDDELEAALFAIGDNRSSELGVWDQTALLGDLERFQVDQVALELIGFDTSALDALAAEVTSVRAHVREIPPPRETVDHGTMPGDVWQLGEHRLMCGDAENEDHVARLLGADVPFLMVTDPPYGVEYDPDWRNQAAAAGKIQGTPNRSNGTVQNDDRAIWSRAWDLFPGRVAYVWHAPTFGPVVDTSLQASRFEIRASIVWVKPRLVVSRGHYHWQHEAALYGVRPGKGGARWSGGRKQSTVWEIARRDGSLQTNHATQKPVECMERPMRNHGRAGTWVYDPFGGSGTSIVAAERAERRCLAMEIDPGYCNMAVTRWEALTNRKAVRVPAS